MSSSERVFVAGGTGMAGRAYSQALVARGYDVTATARDEDGANALAGLGVQPVALDLVDVAATAQLVKESSAVVVAVMGRGQQAAAQEETITCNVIDAAARAGTTRLIYTSVHGADRDTGVPHFDVKGRLERYLAAASVPATVLRPCTFMDALVAPWILDGVLSRGVLTSPIAIDAPISYVATSDLAEIAARALEEPDLAGATIKLGGPRPVTYRELLPKLSELLGQDVRYEQLPLEVVKAQLGSDMAAMIDLFNQEGFAVDADPVIRRLGVDLATVEDFLERALAASAGSGRRSA